MARVSRDTAVVLVGGEGKRLRPLTEQVPKPMLPLLDRPLLAYTLDSLCAAGIGRAVLACGYLSRQVESCYGSRYDSLELDYRVEPEPLGTGGAIKFAAEGLDRTFIALNGDTLREADLAQLLAAHREKQADATLLLARVPDPSRYGLVRLDGDGRVRGFLEKPRPEEVDTDLINAGVYVLEPEVLDLIEPGRPVSIEKEVFPVLAGRGTLYGVQLPGYWLDIGTPESYLEAHHELLMRRGGVEVADDAEISPQAELAAPVAVSAGAVVEAGARVGPLAFVARGARVGAGATIERAILLPNAAVAAGRRVSSAIVAPAGVLACA